MGGISSDNVGQLLKAPSQLLIVARPYAGVSKGTICTQIRPKTVSTSICETQAGRPALQATRGEQ